MDVNQLCDRIDAAAARAGAALDDETANRQYALEQLLNDLAAAVYDARRTASPVISVVENRGVVAGHVHGDLHL